MSLEDTKRVEAQLRDGGQIFPHELTHLTDLPAGSPSSDNTGHRFGLAGLSKLLQVREVDPLAAELDGVQAPATGSLPLSPAQVYLGRVDGALSWRQHPSVRERDAGREPLDHLAGAGCCVGRYVALQQDHL